MNLFPNEFGKSFLGPPRWIEDLKMAKSISFDFSRCWASRVSKHWISPHSLSKSREISLSGLFVLLARWPISFVGSVFGVGIIRSVESKRKVLQAEGFRNYIYLPSRTELPKPSGEFWDEICLRRTVGLWEWFPYLDELSTMYVDPLISPASVVSVSSSS